MGISVRHLAKGFGSFTALDNVSVDIPATEFVMGFVGKVNRLGDAYIRPHEVVICAPGTPDCEPATVGRVLTLGFETRVELTVANGQRVWAQRTALEAERLGLAAGQPVGVDLSRGRAIGWQAVGRRPVPLPVHGALPNGLPSASASPATPTQSQGTIRGNANVGGTDREGPVRTTCVDAYARRGE